MGERMENVEDAIAGGFEYKSQELTGLRGYVTNELTTLTSLMERLLLASAQSNA